MLNTYCKLNDDPTEYLTQVAIPGFQSCVVFVKNQSLLGLYCVTMMWGAVLYCVFASAAVTNCRLGSFLLKGCNPKEKDLSFSRTRDNF